MPNNQITVPVKKSDGSVVRMTLDEFKKFKAGESSAPPVIKEEKVKKDKPTPKKASKPLNLVVPKYAPVEEEKSSKNNLPAKKSENHLSTTTPVKDIFVDEAMAKKENRPAQDSINNKTTTLNPADFTWGKEPEFTWEADDHKSLLEDELPEDVKVQGEKMVVNSYKEMVKEVLGRINFKIDKELQGRLEVLVTSRMKGVRSDDQLIGYATKEPVSGGLGLKDDQVRELLAAIHTILDKYGKDIRAIKKMEPVEETKESATTKTAPGKFEARLGQVKTPTDPTSPMNSEVKELKPIMQDVKSPSIEKKTMGPVDEMHDFSLVDLRRLANKPEKAAEIVLDKFEILKTESFLLYLEAVQAWFQSPLYKMFQVSVRDCLKSGKKLEEFLGTEKEGNDRLTLNEFKSIISINKEIGN